MNKMCLARLIMVVFFALAMGGCGAVDFFDSPEETEQAPAETPISAGGNDQTDPQPPGGDETVPVGSDADPVDNETDPTGNDTDPVDDESDPTGNDTDPVDDESDPAGNDTDPVDDESDPAGNDTDPVDNETDPTGNDTDPVDDETDPTGNDTDPVDDESDPTGNDTDPVDTDPIDGEIEPGCTGTALPDFELEDVNPESTSLGDLLSPQQYRGQVSAWYFMHTG